MIKQKKGLGMGMVILIMVAVIAVSAIVLFYLVGPVSGSIKSVGTSSVCTLSLFQGRGIARCPIDDVRIFDDKVEIKYGNEEEYEELMKIRSTSKQDDVNEALARLLQTCLNRGGGLGSRAFRGESGFGETTVCLECANLVVDEAGIGSSLGKYLREEGPPSGVSDKTYIELLTINPDHLEGYMETGIQFDLAPGKTFNFIPDEDYTIFFLGIKKGSGIPIWNTINAVWDAANLNFDDLFGPDGTYFTYITKSSNLGTICERKVN